MLDLCTFNTYLLANIQSLQYLILSLAIKSGELEILSFLANSEFPCSGENGFSQKYLLFRH